MNDCCFQILLSSLGMGILSYLSAARRLLKSAAAGKRRRWLEWFVLVVWWKLKERGEHWESGVLLLLLLAQACVWLVFLLANPRGRVQTDYLFMDVWRSAYPGGIYTNSFALPLFTPALSNAGHSGIHSNVYDAYFIVFYGNSRLYSERTSSSSQSGFILTSDLTLKLKKKKKDKNSFTLWVGSGLKSCHVICSLRSWLSHIVFVWCHQVMKLLWGDWMSLSDLMTPYSGGKNFLAGAKGGQMKSCDINYTSTNCSV